jgi:hypothetical protein
MDSAESRAFSTSSRMVVYKDFPGWIQHHCVSIAVKLAILISDRFRPKNCITIGDSNITESKG